MSIINISICLTDIPKEKIQTAKNGKKYLNLVVSEKKEIDQYGKTHTVYLQQSKEEREAKADKQYLGNGEIKVFNNGNQPQQVPPAQTGVYVEAKYSPDDDLNLPF